MTINKISKEIKCDTLFCNKNASYEINSKSYKGLTFLCEKCLKEFEKLFKKATKDV